MITKFSAAALALTVLASATLATRNQAEARNGGAFVAGLVGGASLGAAAASAHHYHGPRYYHAPAYAPGYEPVYVPACKKVLVEDHYGNLYQKKVCH